MSHSIQQTPSPTLQAHEMELGEVIFREQRYLAVLHYHGADGSAVQVSEEMKNIQGIYSQLLQQMLITADPQVTTKQLLGRISKEGFAFNEAPEAAKHTSLKTQEVWQQLLFLISDPTLWPCTHCSVELTEESRNDSTLSAHQMTVGKVNFQNHTYKAIINYCDEDGSPLCITNTMRQAQEIYQRMLQKMLEKGSLNLASGGQLERISLGGFIFSESKEQIPDTSHSTVKTEQAWTKILFLLRNPELASEAGREMDLNDLAGLSAEKRIDLLRTIIAKFTASQEDLIELEDLEKKVLRVLRFENLSQGKKNSTELMDLIAATAKMK